MGGMGFIENNKAECMQSVLINTNLLIACKENGIKRYFFSSSACAYNQSKQNDVFVEALKENDAYPLIQKIWLLILGPKGGKNYSVNECADILWRTMELKLELPDIITFMVHLEHLMVVEKRHLHLCRKIIYAKKNNEDKIDVWGDGKQTRSFLYIDDCIERYYKIV